MTNANPVQPNTPEPSDPPGEPVPAIPAAENTPTGKSSSKKLVIIAVLLFIFVFLPICIALLVVAIIAVNPAGKIEPAQPLSPTEISEAPTTLPASTNTPTVGPATRVYQDPNLNFSITIPSNWTVDYDFNSGDLGKPYLSVRFLDGESLQLIASYYISAHGVCENYAGAPEEANYPATNIITEQIILNGKQEDILACYYDDIFDYALVVIEDENINDEFGLEFAITKELGLEKGIEYLQTIEY